MKKITILFNKFSGLFFIPFFVSMFLFVMSLPNNAYAQTTITTSYTTAGLFSWTAPANVTSVTVEVWGGGGGGGGSINNGNSSGGGGGGAYSKSTGIVVVPGTSYNIGVGAGGGGGAKKAGANGTSGNSSYFKTLATLSAVGGNPGTGNNGSNGIGGTGGSSASGVGVIRYSGGNGSAGNGTIAGAGGSSGGTASDGGNASGATGGVVAGGGSGGNANSAGVSPGGGGGGVTGSNNGRNGAMGRVTITYVIPATFTIGTNAAVTAANICPNTSNVPLHSFSLTGANNPGTVTSISLTTNGTYLATDVSNFKLWKTTTSTFTSPIQVGTTIVDPGAAGLKTFSGFSQAVGNSTVYFWVTMDVTATAASGRTISASGTVPANITSTTTRTGSSTSSGVQTLGIGAAPAAPVAIAASSVACTSFSAKWNASAGTSGYFLDVSTSNTFVSFVAGYSNLSVGNVLIWNVVGLTSGTTYYYRVRADKCGSASTNSNVITVATTAVPANPGNPTAALVCNPPRYVLTRSGAPGGGGVTWYWQGTNPAGTSTALNATSTYTATSTGTYYLRAMTSGGCWSAGSGSVSVTVNNVTGGSIASNQSYCGSTDPVAFSETATSAGGPTYSWQYDASSSFSAPTTVSGAVSNVYDPPVLANTRYYRRVATVGSCAAYSNTVEVMISSTPAITASADVTVCNGSTISLSASGGLANSYSWAETTGLGSPYSYSTTASPSATTTYTVTGYAISTEKVGNGSFSAGNTGFTSDYVYAATASNALVPEGRYAIVNGNASLVHNNFNTAPHSPTYQMVVNGAGNPGANVWCVPFPVAANTDYAFSAWVSTCNVGDGTINGRAKLQFSINGVVLGDPFYSPATVNTWQQFFSSWNSGTATSATICVVNLNVTANGNDFALDDMSFAPYCPGSDEVTVTVSQPALKSTLDPSPICSGSEFNYNATSAFESPTYEWTREAVADISGGASAGTGDIIDTLVNASNVPVDVTYNYVTTSNSCSGNSQSVKVRVNPKGCWMGIIDRDWFKNGNWCGMPSCTGDAFIPTFPIGARFPEIGADGAVCRTLTISAGASLDFLSVYGLDICGNWINNGTFTPASGRASFIGSANQMIGGTADTNIFYDLTINNTGTMYKDNVILNKPAEVSNQLNLTDGILVTTQTNLLTLTNSSDTATNDGNSTGPSFVSGPMRWNGVNGPGTYIFPTGKAPIKWARISIKDISEATDFQAEYFNSSFAKVSPADMAASPTPVLFKVSTKEYWQCSRVAGNGSGKLTLYWESADWSGISSCSSLKIGHWDPNNNTNSGGTFGSWENNNNEVTIGGMCSGNNAGTISSNQAVTEFSPFTFGDSLPDVTPLPIELIYFDAFYNGKTVDINWETASEINNAYFTIERSVDAIHFYEVCSAVPSKAPGGNSTSILSYNVIDSRVSAGIYYYRLKQTDLNGSYKYSTVDVVEIKGSIDFSFDIGPNPCDGKEFSSFITADKNKEIVIVVYDVLGQEMYSKAIVTEQKGNTVYIIDLHEKLHSGLYVISATSDQTVYSKRMVVN